MCKKMGWDYYTYVNQPEWFIDILRVIEDIDYQYEKSNKK